MGETLTVASFLNIQGRSCLFCLIIISLRLRTVDLFLLKVMWPCVTHTHDHEERKVDKLLFFLGDILIGFKHHIFMISKEKGKWQEYQRKMS